MSWHLVELLQLFCLSQRHNFIFQNIITHANFTLMIVEKLEKEGKINIKQEIKAKVTAQQLE